MGAPLKLGEREPREEAEAVAQAVSENAWEREASAEPLEETVTQPVGVNDAQGVDEEQADAENDKRSDTLHKLEKEGEALLLRECVLLIETEKEGVPLEEKQALLVKLELVVVQQEIVAESEPVEQGLTESEDDTLGLLLRDCVPVAENEGDGVELGEAQALFE